MTLSCLSSGECMVWGTPFVRDNWPVCGDWKGGAASSVSNDCLLCEAWKGMRASSVKGDSLVGGDCSRSGE